MAKAANNKSMANPREAESARLMSAKAPDVKSAGAGFTPRNGAIISRGRPKNRKFGIHHRPIVSAIKLMGTGTGLVNRPMTEPSHSEAVAGETIFNS